ncbi:L,D-transpeptidase family protein [Novosphingobium umbonatum]|nr:L,D-transpeptidase family protein [Novosphingobium umbonatum]
MAERRNRLIGNSLVALAVAGMAAPLLAQNQPIEGKQGLGKLPNVRPASMQIKLPVPAEAPANPASSAPAKVEAKAEAKAGPLTTPTPAATPAPAPTASPAPASTTAPSSPPTMVIVPNPVPVAHWTLADAKELLAAIRGLAAEGLYPADYQPAALQAAIAAGEGEALDQQASRSFAWAVEDLRDGRTPMPARVQWFAVDPDQDDMTTEGLLERATTNHDVHATLDSLTPTYPDYQALKDALAATPKAQVKLRESIRINMDRWRWLPRDLGQIYLITNVPEFQLRLTVNGKAIRTYRTVVGKPGKTATPQLAEKVEAVVFNPTWTVPQSIVVGEGLGEKLIGNPASALKQGYKVTRLGDGSISVVQQPGDNNSLGRMKIDMPNPHAIYLHDTPAKALFNANVRAFSHGCIRTERAVELGMTMAILGAGMSQEEAVGLFEAKKYRRVVMTRTFPVYLTYVTYGTDITGKMTAFADIYGRDAPVAESFRQPRQIHTTQRASTEAVIKLDNPL